jgi:WD40 repeat protein
VVIGSPFGQMFYWDFGTKQTSYLTNYHNDSVSVLLKLSNGKLASASYDTIIALWRNSSSNKTCSTQYGIHTNRITTLAEGYDGKLISGSEDSTVRFWSSDNCSGMGSLNVGNSVVALVTIVYNGSNCLIVARSDMTVLIYNYDTLNLTQTVNMGNSIIAVMNIFKSTFTTTGHVDGNICMHNLPNNMTMCFTEHSQRVVSLTMLNRTMFFTSSADFKINFWSANGYGLVLLN